MSGQSESLIGVWPGDNGKREIRGSEFGKFSKNFTIKKRENEEGGVENSFKMSNRTTDSMAIGIHDGGKWRTVGAASLRMEGGGIQSPPQGGTGLP